MPNVFLIQVTGQEAEDWSRAPTKAAEPIEYGFYEHGNWHNQPKDEDFGEITEDDRILLYTTANVDDAPKQIKYIFRVRDKIEEREDEEELGIPNKLLLDQVRRLSPGVPLEKIRQWVDDGTLSEQMNRAGTQGFNLTRVTESDYETIVDWVDAQDPTPTIEHYEEELRTFIVEHGLSVISDEYAEYELYQDSDGKSGELYSTPVGEIDLLYQHPRSGDFVVVELKRTQDTSDRVVGQIARYLGWVNQELAPDDSVHGLIVAQTASERLEYAVRALADCGLSTYQLQFVFSNHR